MSRMSPDVNARTLQCKYSFFAQREHTSGARRFWCHNQYLMFHQFENLRKLAASFSCGRWWLVCTVAAPWPPRLLIRAQRKVYKKRPSAVSPSLVPTGYHRRDAVHTADNHHLWAGDTFWGFVRVTAILLVKTLFCVFQSWLVLFAARVKVNIMIHLFFSFLRLFTLFALHKMTSDHLQSGDLFAKFADSVVLQGCTMMWRVQVSTSCCNAVCVLFLILYKLQ